MPIVALGDHNVEVIKMPGEHTLTFFGATFDDEVLAAEIPVLVDIWADGCEACRRIAPLIEVMATEYTGIAKAGKLNAMSNTGTAMKYNIRTVPTVLVFKGSKEGSVRATGGSEPGGRPACDAGLPLTDILMST